MKWKTELTLPGGHRTMRDHQTKLPALVDQSGDTPEHCDDGVLRLKIDDPIVVGPELITVTVFVERNGEDAVAPIGHADVLVLAERYDMPIELRDRKTSRTYRLERYDTWAYRHRHLLPDEATLGWVSYMGRTYPERNLTKEELKLAWTNYAAGKAEFDRASKGGQR